MAKMNTKQVKNLVYWFYFFRGKYPPGTSYANFEQCTMGDLQVDDPPLPGDPHFEKKKLAVELQFNFYQLGYKLPSPLQHMKAKNQSLGTFHKWCHAEHQDL